MAETRTEVACDGRESGDVGRELAKTRLCGQNVPKNLAIPE
jgi:hypothetical protein